MLYELRQYDTPLLTFNVERKELDNFVFDVNWVDEKNKYLLPIGMTADSDGLSKWLKSFLKIVNSLIGYLQKAAWL